jgi:hypothetical protein
MTLIDLSHPIDDGMAAYPGLRLCASSRSSTTMPHATVRRTSRVLSRRCRAGGNTGTYLDAPFHRSRTPDLLTGPPRSPTSRPPPAGVRLIAQRQRSRTLAGRGPPTSQRRSLIIEVAYHKNTRSLGGVIFLGRRTYFPVLIRTDTRKGRSSRMPSGDEWNP